MLWICGKHARNGGLGWKDKRVLGHAELLVAMEAVRDAELDGGTVWEWNSDTESHQHRGGTKSCGI